MSILGSSPLTLADIYLLIGIIVALLLSTALALVAKVHRREVVVGPERLPTARLALQLVVGVAMGIISMILAQALYDHGCGYDRAPAHTVIVRTPTDWAFSYSVPPLAFFGTLLLFDWAVGGIELLAGLGLSLDKFFPGVAKGLLAAVIIIPPTFALSIAAEWFYQRVQYPHEHEHQLLRIMREPESPLVHWALIAAPAVIAPLFEELLFRGHVQSLIRRALVGISSILTQSLAPEVTRPQGELAGGVIPYWSGPTRKRAPVEPGVWHTWMAILLSSMLFTAVHPLWMAPPIFFLALGLGYCYERTGNLWTCMTVHCLFNTVSTFIFLNFESP